MMNIPADICEKRLLSIISAVYMKELMSLCQNVQYVCLCEIRSCTLLDWWMKELMNAKIDISCVL